ncbi:MAG: flagellar motor protein PomA [Azospirillum sp.]|nr:flagellar motor protein PomA [Azospirillum sp.]
MDIATPIGIVASFAVVMVAIVLGGDVLTYVDIPSVFIVIGGTIGATIIRFTFNTVVSALKTGISTALNQDRTSGRDLIDEGIELLQAHRKGGPVALEAVKIRNELLGKGVTMVIDGFAEPVIRDVLLADRDRTADRLDQGVRIFRAIGDAAPAFGMIGTLVGLVAMLASMDDPSKIGPSMAVALLTTLYGALISNVIALPIADKLEAKISSEYVNRTMIVDIVLGIQRNGNPDMLRDQLEVYLAPAERRRPDAPEAGG